MRGSRAGALLATALGVTTLSACGAGGGVLSSEQQSPEPGFTQTIAPRPETVTAKPSVPAGRRVKFSTIVFTLPDGWRLGPRSDGSTCAAAPGQTSCLAGALTIKILPIRPGGGIDWPAAVLNDPGGWLGSSPTVCYAPGAVDPDVADVSRGRLTVTATIKLPRGEQASYRQWEVPCTSGKTFTARLWYIGSKRVVLYTLGANPAYGPAYDDIVKSADMTRFRAREPVPSPADGGSAG
jgi:hypothetical protein